MLEDFFTYEKIYLAVISFIVVVVILVIRRLVNKSITSFCARLRLEKHIANMLSMLSNILIYAAGITIILQTWGLPTEWFVGVSALT